METNRKFCFHFACEQQQRPLTRYLPIRSDGFDLRQHVETAGHQVELCPHVTLTSTSARGYLHKMGSRFKTWNKRWFVFDRMQRTFLYYTDKNESRKRGGAYFQVSHITFRFVKLHELTSFVLVPVGYRRSLRRSFAVSSLAESQINVLCQDT